MSARIEISEAHGKSRYVIHLYGVYLPIGDLRVFKRWSTDELKNFNIEDGKAYDFYIGSVTVKFSAQTLRSLIEQADNFLAEDSK